MHDVTLQPRAKSARLATHTLSLLCNVCVCVCVRACARACVRAGVRVCGCAGVRVGGMQAFGEMGKFNLKLADLNRSLLTSSPLPFVMFTTPLCLHPPHPTRTLRTRRAQPLPRRTSVQMPVFARTHSCTRCMHALYARAVCTRLTDTHHRRCPFFSRPPPPPTLAPSSPARPPHHTLAPAPAYAPSPLHCPGRKHRSLTS